MTSTASRKATSGPRLAYVDNAATCQMPEVIVEALAEFERSHRANVHRGVYPLSERATSAYEEARERVGRFLNAKTSREIVFTHGCTEALNLVAESFLRPKLGVGDEIVLTMMEHHANIIPWQSLAKELGARLKVVPLTDAGELDLEELEAHLSRRCKLLTLVHVSNVLGTVNPIAEVTQVAKRHGVPVCVDGAQAPTHTSIDVQALGVDFYVISGHKMFAPFGIGALYARWEHLKSMQPYQKGGNMIEKVSFTATTYAPAPMRFEAGTPNITGAVGLGLACCFIESLQMQALQNHDKRLQRMLQDSLEKNPEYTVYGSSPGKVGIVSFSHARWHSHDMATILGTQGVCVRAGHHCCMPLMDYYEVPATLRVSFAPYNTEQDVLQTLEALRRVGELLDG